MFFIILPLINKTKKWFLTTLSYHKETFECIIVKEKGVSACESLTLIVT